MSMKDLNDKKIKYFQRFKDQLENGIQYYKNMIPSIYNQTEQYRKKMQQELEDAEKKILSIFSIIVPDDIEKEDCVLA